MRSATVSGYDAAMTPILRDRLAHARSELHRHFHHGIVRFWRERAEDRMHGGFHVRYDAEGRLVEGESDKSLISQTRAIWGFANFFRATGDPADLRVARQGVDFLIRRFWDGEHGGWHWMTARDGTLRDAGKVVYGHAFAIYALADYARASGDARALDYACRTFDVLQRNAIDVRHGGWFENLERDWTSPPGGAQAGDRKTLNTHMHVMEALTVLYQATGSPVHRRRLEESIALITERMLDPATGCCRAQFALDLSPIPAISIVRTWDHERQGTPVDAPDQELTCYGHNVEFGWLLVRAGEALGHEPGRWREHVRRLCDHALRWGVDPEHGGVYCAGPFDAPATNTDKEFWENMEVLPGFLDAYSVVGDERYLDAFLRCWAFSRDHLINHDLGEWRFLCARDGTVKWGDLGCNWKINYHSGRSCTEALLRLDRILGRAAAGAAA